MANYQTPGVYVEEISTLPPSVAPVATAIPAFIGYTETGIGKVEQIGNLLEYRTLFGGPYKSTFDVSTHLDSDTGQYVTDSIQRKDGAGATKKRIFPLDGADTNPPKYHLFYSVAHFFENGGGKCYIASAGAYDGDPSATELKAGLDKLRQEDEPTLLVFADAVGLDDVSDYYNLCEAALTQCKETQDRFGVFDVKAASDVATAAQGLRNELSHDELHYGAAYYPYLHTTLNYRIEPGEEGKIGVIDGPNAWESELVANGAKARYESYADVTPSVLVTSNADANTPVTFQFTGGDTPTLTIDAGVGKSANDVLTEWDKLTETKGFILTVLGDGSANLTERLAAAGALTAVPMVPRMLDTLKTNDTALYNHVKKALTKPRVILPPSAAMVGIYARVDRDRGVWKAPANVSVAAIGAPVVKITHEQQEGLNVDPTAGKSINAIRTFAGKGTLVWGARTLAGNDNEWRYIPVRRLFIMIEESAKKATSFAVFEPNDATTWLKVKGMIEAFLYGLWEKGALQGSSPDQAYFVNIGLGKTMTVQDILEGRLIVEIGIAAVRPAEFIVLRFMHKLVEG